VAPSDLQTLGPAPPSPSGPASTIAPLQGAPPSGLTFLGRRITPLTRRRLDNFRANKRGFWSLWIFLAVFVVTLFAEFVANDRPLLIKYNGGYYMPVFHAYPETTFGGVFPTEADYHDPEVLKLIQDKGWILTATTRLPTRRVPSPRRHRRPIGSAPTTRAATCWPG
jgi:microcin C transport system permease protein